MLLKVASAYRTVSTEALQLMTGCIPIDILVKKRGRLHNRELTRVIRNTKRTESIKKLQDRCTTNNAKAAWIIRLIPNIDQCLKGTYRHTN